MLKKCITPSIRNVYIVLVCANIKLQISDEKNKSLFSRQWKLDSCYGPKKFASLKSIQDEVNKTYMDRCCLKPGIYTLVCRNEMGPYGWGNSFIEIMGQRYCDDFVGYKGLRRVIVTGKKLKQFYYTRVINYFHFEYR